MIVNKLVNKCKVDFKYYQRIIIKVGSSLTVDPEGFFIRNEWLEFFAEDVYNLIVKEQKEVVLVVSGSLAIGCKHLQLDRVKLNIDTKRACASYGQLLLSNLYQKIFDKYNVKTSQILLTVDDFDDRERVINLKDTISELLELGIVPIINENDAITNDMIKFHDNDHLAARVTQVIDGDLLILLSDVDGLYDKNPKLYKEAQLIEEVKEITREIKNMAKGSGSTIGTGGMRGKIQAARLVMRSGTNMIITNGKDNKPIALLHSGDKRYTLFHASDKPLTSRRKIWIMNLKVKGDIIIDDGAKEALKKGASLLAKGVVTVQGKFYRGDALFIKDKNFIVIAKGLAEFNSNEAMKIAGNHSDDFEKILGYKTTSTLVHRDYMLFMN